MKPRAKRGFILYKSMILRSTQSVLADFAQSQSAEAIFVAFSACAVGEQNITLGGFMDGGVAKSASLVVFNDFGKLKILGFFVQKREI